MLRRRKKHKRVVAFSLLIADHELCFHHRLQLANVDQMRIDRLHQICEDSAKGIAKHGHATEAVSIVERNHSFEVR